MMGFWPGIPHGFIMEKACRLPSQVLPQVHIMNKMMTWTKCCSKALGCTSRTLGTDDGAEDDLDVDAEAYYKLVNDGSQELYPAHHNTSCIWNDQQVRKCSSSMHPMAT